MVQKKMKKITALQTRNKHHLPKKKQNEDMILTIYSGATYLVAPKVSS